MTVEDLETAGLAQMDDAAIEDFLRSQRFGILGLPADGAPYLVPISFGYDGDALYFTFIGGPESQKRTLIRASDTATFLVTDVSSMFNWESVVLTGTPERVPESEWDELADVLGGVWRPEVFEDALESEDIVIFRFDVEERNGIRHTGLPEGFRNL
ncbi:pyridoxamine 5'-phosphate oxidase family protein [Halomicroarcula sp. GCM10025324]|uniref:pyridoxamine 5'-phosphate oxidase family protein n=1 Tax=Haloarcula TaxID=2237 RepID=UPI0023E761F3|nr:pyridoxamine 5'-phosphate oxidase family protein [Halomicroarcula sp. ZS-22-S1]